MLTQNDPAKLVEPRPPLVFIKSASHHWLQEVYDDGRPGQPVVLQWSPASERWCISGDVASGIFMDTRGWKYLAPCPVPDFG